jgi:hypothetical protein
MPKKLIEALSDAAVRSAKPALREGVAADRKLHDGRGLYLLIRAAGAKHWRLKYHLAGRERLLALGEYPDVLWSRARQKAGDARKLVRQGIDPLSKRTRTKNPAHQRRLANFRRGCRRMDDQKIQKMDRRSFRAKPAKPARLGVAQDWRTRHFEPDRARHHAHPRTPGDRRQTRNPAPGSPARQRCAGLPGTNRQTRRQPRA